MLSDLEQAKVMDAEWILTKHQIMEKAQWLMQQQIEPINQSFETLKEELDTAILSGVPKISKGENYKKLPYIILDYPAVFSKKDIFALRTLFWWGNNFSVHLLISGIYLKQFRDKLFKNLQQTKVEFYICVNDTEWEHHFEADNFVRISEENIILARNRNSEFVKIALQFSLEEWNKLPQLLPDAYQKMVNLLKN